MKVTYGHDGKLITYGFSGEKLRNYRKYGIYTTDDDPRLRGGWYRRWRRLVKL